MVYTSLTVSPTIVSVYIISGWVMGRVKDKHLKYSSTGDKYVGQCATGLENLKKQFSISSPHFFSQFSDDVLEQIFLKNETQI